jgi:antitoxin component of MazEF toxin-antitoxin module
MSNEKNSTNTEVNPAAVDIDPHLVRQERLSDRPLKLCLPTSAERLAIARNYPAMPLADLLEDTTPENRHPEIDFGLPVGREFPNEAH